MGAAWEAKKRGLEEEFARKEQELRKEQVEKMGNMGPGFAFN